MKALSVLFLGTLFTFTIALSCGSVPLSLEALIQGFFSLFGVFSPAIDAVQRSILELRLERASVAYLTGGSLALSGLCIQILVRNPLADPALLGISSGASLGALLALFLGYSGYWIQGSAFLGALAVGGLLWYWVQHELTAFSASQMTFLLLSGVMISSLCSAGITLILSLAHETPLRGMVFWLMGDLSNAGFSYTQAGLLLVCLVMLMKMERGLSIFALQGDHALTLGVPVPLLKHVLFLVSGALTATAVSTAGNIAFIGLVIPHAIRFLLGQNHPKMIPATMMAGGIVLTLSDTLARTLVAPMQWPVGVVTAFVGAPLFLIQLKKQYSS